MESRHYILVLFLFLLIFGIASSKHYSLEKAELYYKIEPDGLVKAEEKITFDFSGSFSFAYRDFPLGEWTYENIKVFDITSGKPKELKTEKSHQSGELRVKWFYSASNEKRIFKIEYSIANAVKAYSDVGEFYWKVWGKGWDHSLKELIGYIELPKKVSDSKKVYSWGHPKLNGKIGLLENKKLLFQAFNIPSGQWVEVRIAFPRELLSTTGKAREFNYAGLEKIIEEEKNYKEKPLGSGVVSSPSNNWRTGFYLFPMAIVFWLLFVFLFFLALLKPEGVQKIASGIRIMLLVLALSIFSISWIGANLFLVGLTGFLEIGVFVLCWYLYGREPKTELQAIYEREIPFDYSPALVDALSNQWTKKPKTKSMVAEMLDLCLKGKLKLEKIKKKTMLGEKDSYKIHILEYSEENLPKSERVLFQLIKKAAEVKMEGLIVPRKVKDKTPNQVTLDELSNYLRMNRMEAQKILKKWKNAVKEKAEEMGFFSPKNAIIPFVVGTVALMVVSSFIYPFLFIEVLFAAIVLNALFPNILPNRSKKGALHYERWMKLKAFLSDFSNLKNMPPDAIVLWEKYLVYAIPLGVAEKVQKAMDKVFKDYAGEYQSRIFIGRSYSSFSTTGFGSAVGAFSSSFNSAAGTSGSGGFSGGGGAAGGGGGGGAG